MTPADSLVRGFAREPDTSIGSGVQKLLTTFLALLALAMGLSHAGAMAAGPMAAGAPMVTPVEVSQAVDGASADMPCHGAAAEAAMPANAADAGLSETGQSAPDCCPDGCKGGCAMLAALSGEAVAALPDALHGQTPLPVEARAPADRPHGLKRPPRTTA